MFRRPTVAGRRVGLATALFTAVAPAAVAQPPAPLATALTLAEAMQRADRHHYGNRAARANADAQRTAELAALRGILPSVRAEAGVLRTSDPIAVFGTILRQRTITQQNFDPTRLNFPAPATNYLGGFVVELPLVNADAWVGRRAARHASDATTAQADWIQAGARVDVVKAWYGTMLSGEKVAALENAVRAAQGHVKRAEAMARGGVVTTSDAMLASVKAGEVETMLVEARGEAGTARLALATIMGTPADTAEIPTCTMPAARALVPLALAARDTIVPGIRADVRAAAAGDAAAQTGTRRARSLYLPRLNAFARYDWNSAVAPFGGDNNWSVGVMATWSPFAGASEVAQLREADARSSAATAMRDGATARAAMELAQSASALTVALARLEIAERATRQATDAHRIVARKYDGGLAAVVELLDASAAETQSRLGETAARYHLIVATAERLRALGADLARLAELDRVP